MNDCKVSIIFPVYNTAKYLPECLDSILGQTFTDFEVIAVDDGSTDNSLAILREYAAKDSRIKVFENEKNLGVSETSNKAIALASTDLLVRMDSDDIMPSCRLEKQYDFFQKHPDYVILGGQVQIVDENNNNVFLKEFPHTHDEIMAKLFVYNPFQQGALMMNRKDIPKDFVWYNNDIPIAEDLDLMFRLLPYGMTANLPDVLLRYRVVDISLSRNNPKETFKWIDIVRKKAVQDYGFKPSFKDRLMTFVQKVAVTILPNKLIESIFFLFRRLVHKDA